MLHKTLTIVISCVSEYSNYIVTSDEKGERQGIILRRHSITDSFVTVTRDIYSNNFLGRGDGDNDFDDSLRAFGQTFNNSVLSNLNNVDSTWASRLVSQKMRRLSVVNKLLKDSEQDEWQILQSSGWQV